LHEVRNGDESCLEWYATLTDKNRNVFNIPGVNVIKVRDGKFESVHAYFDPTVLNA
jgi:ketosteroid isomerase-like protein